MFNEIGQPYLRILYMAMISTIYYGLFRIGEIAKGGHTVLARDVHIGTNKNKMLFVLRTSKTHWSDGDPQMIKISAKRVPDSQISEYHARPRFCPFQLLRDYLSCRLKYRKNTKVFFIYNDRSTVPQDNFRKVLYLALDRCKIDRTNYGSHSLRAGRCLDLFRYGVSVETIKKIGRWKSNAIYSYLK